MRSLPLFHRVTGQPVIVLGDGVAAEAKRRLVERAGGVVVDDLEAGIERGARLAFVALEDEGADAEAADRLRGAGLLVNVADRPRLCDFTTPSVLDRDPVLLAIGTDGTSAGLAKHLRLRLEALLPAGLGRLAEALDAAKAAIRSRWPEAEERRYVLDRALAEGGVLDPLSGAGPQQVADWLSGEIAVPKASRIEFAVTPDPSALTLRQLQLLGAADTILFDAGVPDEILNRARADALRRPLAGDDGRERPGLTLVLRLA